MHRPSEEADEDAEDEAGEQTHAEPVLSQLSERHPGEVAKLSQVFRDTTTSYKLFWFRSLLAHLRDGRTARLTARLTVRSLLDEMVVQAWCPVFLYRLSLGVQDRLQGIVHDLGAACQLPRTATRDEVRDAVRASVHLRARIDAIGRYVPTRFLAPWFASVLRGRVDATKDGAIRRLGGLLGRSSRAPYSLGPDPRVRTVRLDRGWLDFLTENLGVIEAFGDFHLAKYLQARNPAVPGVLRKLDPPVDRDTSRAREFWAAVLRTRGPNGAGTRLRDIYTGRSIDSCESIDHFLPWSFVAHDQQWNLVPVERSTNSTKSDAIPDLDLYLPRLASTHHAAVRALRDRPRLLEDHVQFFGRDVAGLADAGAAAFLEMYKARISPQAQIAANQGFPGSWRYASAVAHGRDGAR